MTLLKRFRLECGLTQQEMANILGVSVSTIQKREAGKIGYSFAFSRMLRRTFGLSIACAVDISMGDLCSAHWDYELITRKGEICHEIKAKARSSKSKRGSAQTKRRAKGRK